MTPIPTPDEIRSIYAGIEKLPITQDTQGWNSDGPIFKEVIEATNPKVIVEVGTWKFRSAIHMAGLTVSMGLDTKIYAVDCWMPPIGVGLGEIPRTQIPERFDAITFYQQCLFNVKKSGFDDRIIPVRGLTTCIASLLQAWEVVADAIYIDASHDEFSAYRDAKAYWPILRNGGIMFGDDYSSHEGVRLAINRFSREINHPIREIGAAEGTQWMLSPK